MQEGKTSHQTVSESAGSRLAAGAGEVATVEEKRKGSKAWLFGAYTFLILWGMAYLVLFFTDRLPF
jgi:hypothetical protein